MFALRRGGFYAEHGTAVLRRPDTFSHLGIILLGAGADAVIKLAGDRRRIGEGEPGTIRYLFCVKGLTERILAPIQRSAA